MNNYVHFENGNRIRTPQDTLARALKLLDFFSNSQLIKIHSPLKTSSPCYKHYHLNNNHPFSDSRNLSTLGKGLTDLQAQVSCAMESLEYIFSDQFFHSQIKGSFNYLKKCFPIIDPNLYFNPYFKTPDLADNQFQWIFITCSKTKELILVPAPLIIFPYQNTSFFPCSTNGLSSGNSLEETLIHGLYELIERHIMTLSSQGLGFKTKISKNIFPKEILTYLSDDFEFQAYFLETFKEEKIPVIEFQIIYQKQIFSGHGCDLNFEKAFIRAFTEAVQVLNVNFTQEREDQLKTRMKSSNKVLTPKRLPLNIDRTVQEELSTITSVFTKAYQTPTEELKDIEAYLERNNHGHYFYKNLYQAEGLFFTKIISLSLLQPKKFFSEFSDR